MSDYGYIRVAATVPRVHVADPEQNLKEITALAMEAFRKDAQVIVFPELALTGYTCGDLFLQSNLHAAAEAALEQYLQKMVGFSSISILGMPLRVDDKLFNVAVVTSGEEILAVIPKTYLPGYKEFYETRWFAPADRLRSREIELLGRRVPIGTDLIVAVRTSPRGVAYGLGVEICEDLWMPIPPSSAQALAGVHLLVNLSASNVVLGKPEYRRQLVSQQAARCIAGYVYVSCGYGESTADVVFDGHAIIAEDGRILRESERFSPKGQCITADLDIERLQRERMLTGSFGQGSRVIDVPQRHVSAAVTSFPTRTRLNASIDPYPFVPSDPATRDARCEEIFAIQATGLMTRLEHRELQTGSREVAIGVSGGLDSTLALLVTVRTFELLGWERTGIHAYTLPGFGTTERTRGNAHRLCEALGVPLTESSIVGAAEALLRAEGHEPCRNCLKCENAQARVRTAILMAHGFVIGTGDLSELALGWCTYGGDHLSMYGVNCDVPKTLVRFVVQWVADRSSFGAPVSAILHDILATPISPELLPPSADGEIAQRTEDVLGPYELHDFFLYHLLRNGFAPEKILFLAQRAFGDRYPRAQLIAGLRVFLERFFGSQFKRNAMPDGPKVGSVALSPRGDHRMPSDIDGALWIRQVEGLAAAA